MSLFRKTQTNEDTNSSNKQMIPIWTPDRSLPYVIHIPGREEKEDLPFVCIWPKVIRYKKADMTRDVLYYYLNREHICEIKLIQKSETTIVFDEDGHFRALGHNGNDPITISVVTEEEFNVIMLHYEKKGWQKLQTKEDLVNNYIDLLDP